MTDRELLERAARAVNGGSWHPLTHIGSWAPLTNPADALWLAVELDLRIEPNFKGENKYVQVGVSNENGCRYDPNDQIIWLAESDLADPVLATCRAITEAAAALAPTL